MRSKTCLVLLSAMMLPSAALAHPGHEHMAGFAQGMAHPFSGIDHMLAMVMVGIFAVQLGGRAIVALPLTFIGAMALGSLSGAAAIAPSVVELAIGLSVIMLGVIIAMQARLTLPFAMALTGMIAWFHGHAHGAEAPGGVSALYLAGFLTGTAILHMGGIAAGLGLARAVREQGRMTARLAGGTAALAGVFLIAG